MQQTLAEATFEQYRKSTRHERFLDEMNRVVPWTELVAVIESIYPKANGPGRPPVGIERMLRLHCLQQWFNLSDLAVEEAFTTRAPYGSLWGLIWAVSPCLMKRRSVSFGTYWRRTSWGNSSLPGLGRI
jgi:Transposase domain (DUF772)